MRVPDGDGGPGGGLPDGLALRPGMAGQGWRGWAGDVAVVLRRGWRVIAAVLLVTTVLPVLVLSGLIAVGVAAGVSGSPHSKGGLATLALAVVTSPVLLALMVWCGLVVARGWSGAVWAGASAGAGRPAGVGDALRWGGRRSRLLGASYMIGVAVLVGAAFLAGYAAPQAFTVPDVLVLAGPAGLLAPVLCFAPGAAWRRRTPMALVLAVVVSGEVAAALALSWLMTSASPGASGAGLEGINGPAAAVIASLLALPGSVLLAAASSVSYGRVRGQAETLTHLP